MTPGYGIGKALWVKTPLREKRSGRREKEGGGSSQARESPSPENLLKLEILVFKLFMQSLPRPEWLAAIVHKLVPTCFKF